MAAFVIHK